ncbi:hypothetical protein ECANGB1_734 [Enterospora canceri]|uniref:Uncharacterized protein n=1 Tax=Enterospora canceri TaxID=1081671 RepID=A0A1Y1S7K4_9MICR|nr:hypothetical protein ECANGB1_734 [Enterospora canceri]
MIFVATFLNVVQTSFDRINEALEGIQELSDFINESQQQRGEREPAENAHQMFGDILNSIARNQEQSERESTSALEGRLHRVGQARRRSRFGERSGMSHVVIENPRVRRVRPYISPLDECREVIRPSTSTATNLVKMTCSEPAEIIVTEEPRPKVRKVVVVSTARRVRPARRIHVSSSRIRLKNITTPSIQNGRMSTTLSIIGDDLDSFIENYEFGVIFLDRYNEEIDYRPIEPSTYGQNPKQFKVVMKMLEGTTKITFIARCLTNDYSDQYYTSYKYDHVKKRFMLA